MGLLTDYFIAPDDAAAAGAVSRGPSALFPTVEGNGLEPTVHLGTLEEILTGRTFEEVLDDARDPVAHQDDYSVLVVPVSVLLLDALLGSSPEALSVAATSWSQTEELAGSDPEPLAAFLADLAELTRKARSTNSGIYCWVCV